MEHRDLGVLGDDVVLFGGPYSNIQALNALLAATDGLSGETRPDRICTGDVVAYCADPVACIDRVRGENIVVVAGNVEAQLAAHALDCGCGFETGSTCDRLSAAWYAYANAAVDDAARTWMAGLPGIATFESAGRRVAVIHGGVTDISRFLWSVSPEAAFAEEVAALTEIVGPVDMIVAGHCGIGFVHVVAGITWVNAGVIGMPPNDGTPLTEFVVLRRGQPELRKLGYPARDAAREMRNRGLSQGYDSALTSGVWPSQDVLPRVLRRV